MHDLNIISGGLEMLPVIKPLRKKLYAHHRGLMPCFAHEFNPIHISENDIVLADKNRTKAIQVFVAETSDHKPVGYSFAKIDIDNNGELDSLFVEKEYRGKGLAKELSMMTIEWMKLQKPMYISVRVLPDNQAAEALYKNIGFTPRSLIMRICDNQSLQGTLASSRP